MNKKFIFINGLFFLITCIGMAMEQGNKLSLLNRKTLRSILHRDPVLLAKIYKYTKKEDQKKMLYYVKQISKSDEQLKRGSIFRFRPYPRYHKRYDDFED